MSDHADLERIAAFREGLLDSADGARVASHLAACSACAARGAALAQVTTRLAHAPDPPLPPEVVQRLDAALAAEITAAGGPAAAARGQVAAAADGQVAAVGHSTGAAGENQQPGTGAIGPRRATRMARARESRTWRGRGHAAAPRGRMAAALRPLAAAAAVCLLAGGGYLLLHTSRSPSTTSSAAPPAGQTGQSGPAQSQGRAIPGRQSQGNGTATAATAAVVVHSNTNYQAGRLPAQAEAALRRYTSMLSAPKTGEMPLQPQASSAVSGCLARIPAVPGRVLVDEATYRGQSAVVVISPASAGRAGHVWVISSACLMSAGHIMMDTSLP